MRSGPSATARPRAARRRQRNRSGGPSGTSAVASIGSGRSNSRIGRTGAEGLGLTQDQTEDGSSDGICSAFSASGAGTAATANSGICVSCGTSRVTPAQAEARAEPIDQMRQFFGVIGRGQSGLHRIATLGDERREPHHVEAEAGIAGIAEDGEPLGERAADAGGSRAAARRCRPRADAPCRRCGTARPASSRAPSPRRSSTQASSAPEIRWCRARRLRARSARRSGARRHRRAPAGAA